MTKYTNLPILGETLTSIVANNDLVIFRTDTGKTFRMEHHQDCCESVELVDVNGDWGDLIGSPLTVAEEAFEDQPDGDWGEIEGWTFYRFATNKGWVTLRWEGRSNGYYGIRVSFWEVEHND